MSRDSLWLVAGATGGTGSHAMQLLWAAGIRTRALTRSKNNESRLRQLGATEIVTGSLLDPQVAAAAVDGVKIVLCAVGPAIKNLFFGEMVDDLGTMNLIDAASRAGVHHFVFESSIGVGDSRDGLSALDRFLLRRELGPKHRAETRLREAGVPFTILRPGRLLHGSANGDLLVTERGGTTTGSIARADVARLMVASPFTTSAHGKTLEVVGAGDGRAPQSQRVTVAWSPPQRREA